ncbi:MAG: hypothetical protein Q9213_005080 [Squamulea squamosa]
MDMQERDQQIMLMREIFTSSFLVCVWLGEHAETYALAFEFMSMMLDAKKCPQDYVISDPGTLTEIRDREQLHDLPFTDSESFTKSMDSVVSLFENHWFGRSWTFQEIVCAPDWVEIQAGDFHASYAIVANYAMLFGPAWYGVDKARRRSIRAYNMIMQVRVAAFSRMQHIGSVGLLDLAQMCRDREATDPKDKLYSLLGIADQTQSPDFSPRYSLATAIVYRDFAASTISRTNTLEILEYVVAAYKSEQCFYAGEQDHRAASWAPDWSVSRANNWENLRLRSSNAAKLARMVGEVEGSKLSVYGMQVDKILVHTTFFIDPATNTWESDEESWMSQYRLLTEVQWLVMNSLALLETEADVESYWAAYTCGLGSDFQRVHQSYQESKDTMIAYIHVLTQLCTGKTERENITQEQLETFEKVQGVVKMISARRRFCITKNGRLGWICGPGCVGVIVVILYGCAVPLLMLPMENGEYQVLEQCYIHGIMDGEAVEEAMKANGISEAEFEDEKNWETYAPMERFIIQ